MQSNWGKIRVFVYHDSRVKSTTKSQDASQLSFVSSGYCCETLLTPLQTIKGNWIFPANPVTIGQNFQTEVAVESYMGPGGKICIVRYGTKTTEAVVKGLKYTHTVIFKEL